MGTLFGFIVGYVVGAKGGSERFDEVLQAFRAVRDSEEFRALLQALRLHASDTARDLGDRLSIEPGTEVDGVRGFPSTDDLIAEARRRFDR